MTNEQHTSPSVKRPARVLTTHRQRVIAGVIFAVWIPSLCWGLVSSWDTADWHDPWLFLLFSASGIASDWMARRNSHEQAARMSGGNFALISVALLLGPVPATVLAFIMNLIDELHEAARRLYMVVNFLALMTFPLIIGVLIEWFDVPPSEPEFLAVALALYPLSWLLNWLLLYWVPLLAEEMTFADVRNQLAQPFTGVLAGGMIVTAGIYTYTHAGLIALTLMLVGLLAFDVMLSRLAHIRFEVVQERDRAERYLDVAANFMYVLDKQGRVQFLNETASRTLGVAAQEAIGREWFELACPSDQAPQEREAYMQLQHAPSDQLTEKESVLIDSAGEQRILSFNISPLQDAYDQFMGIVASGEDITEQRQIEQQRLAAEKLKDEFFALVSHELRTPLSSIIGYLDLVTMGEAGDLDPLMGEYLGVIERNSNRLLRLVEDLLFAAQLEAGKLSLSPGPCDLIPVVRDAVQAAQPRAEQGNVTLDCELVDRASLEGDPGRLGQLCDNLISNAIKYTPAGGSVTVKVSAKPGEWLLEVSDTGIGMSEEDQERLFSRFFRASSATQAAIPGVGLGLTICKAIAEGHNGAIGQRSKLGEGTTFFVRLPSAENDAPSPQV